MCNCSRTIMYVTNAEAYCNRRTINCEYTNMENSHTRKILKMKKRNLGRPRKRWWDQLHLEDQGTGKTPKPS